MLSFDFPVLSRLASLSAALILTCSFGAHAELYLIAGTSTSNYLDIPVRLYKISDTSNRATLVRELSSGMTCVLVDRESRLAVVASPALGARDFSVVNMNKPEAAIERHADYDVRTGQPGSIYLLDMPGGKHAIALALTRIKSPNTVELPEELTLVDLDAQAPDIPIPLDYLRYMKVSGEVGGALTMLETKVVLRGDPLRVTINSRALTTETGMRRPPYYASRDIREGYSLVADDSARAVLEPSDRGFLDVLNKSTGEWRRVPSAFPSSRIRSFGPWLGFIEMRQSGASGPTEASAPNREIAAARTSPGASKREKEEIAPGYRLEPAFTVDDVFQELERRGVYFPDELAAYNLDTGTLLKISTGAGDSEIILVNDDCVYYRVDDTLFLRRIIGSSLGDPVKLAEGEEIVQVHWAFLSDH